MCVSESEEGGMNSPPPPLSKGRKDLGRRDGEKSEEDVGRRREGADHIRAGQSKWQGRAGQGRKYRIARRQSVYENIPYVENNRF
eukprot:162672-Hanusia_phi.AAC.3